MANDDGTMTCAHDGCECRVADTESHPKDNQGNLYCSEGCRDGDGCRHEDCDCANR